MHGEDEDLKRAAALYAAAGRMFDFTLGVLTVALKQERLGGFSADGRQIEPPVAHLIRPALEQFLAQYATVGDAPGDPPMSPEQAARVNGAYAAKMRELREQLLTAIREFEI